MGREIVGLGIWGKDLQVCILFGTCHRVIWDSLLHEIPFSILLTSALRCCACCESGGRSVV